MDVTARLLWTACRPAPDAERVAAAVDAGADVERAARAALPQHVGPLLWRALAAADRVGRLGAMRGALHDETERRRGQGALLLPVALATAVEPLVAAGFEPLVWKGPALAMRYPEPGLRPMDDIDVLLPPEQHAAAMDTLFAAGWRRWPGTADDTHDTVLGHERVPDLPLELHRGLDSWRDRANSLTARTMWRRRVPLTCFGVSSFGLAPEDEIVSIAAHAAKPYHHFQRLIWAVDLAVVTATSAPPIDWATVAHRARAGGCANAVAVGLRLARRLGADVPDELVGLAGVGRLRRAALAPVLDEAWPLVGEDTGTIHRLRYAFAENWRRQVQLALGEVTALGARRVPARMARLATQATRRWRVWRRTGALAP